MEKMKRMKVCCRLEIGRDERRLKNESKVSEDPIYMIFFLNSVRKLNC